MAVYAAVGLIDLSRLPNTFLVAMHLLIAAAAVLALRIAIHLALLKETRDELRTEPVVCAECHHRRPRHRVLSQLRGLHAGVVAIVPSGQAPAGVGA